MIRKSNPLGVMFLLLQSDPTAILAEDMNTIIPLWYALEYFLKLKWSQKFGDLFEFYL